MLALWLFLVLLVLIYLYFKIAARPFLIIDKYFPGPKKLPIIGNALEFCSSNEENYKRMHDLSREMGTTFRIWVGSNPFIVIIDPDDAQALLGSNIHIDKSEFYRLIRPWIGGALLTAVASNNPRWKRHRKIIQSTFPLKVLNGFLNIFNTNGDILVKKLSEVVGPTPVEISEIVGLYALDNITETAMGTQMNFQLGTNSEYLAAMKDVGGTVMQRMAKFWLQNDFIFSLSAAGRVQKKALQLIHSTGSNVITRRRKEILQDDYVKDDDKRKMAFLDLLLESIESSRWPDEYIREEVDGLMLGGHGTITACLSFALYELAAHPHFQERAYQEQVEIFGDSYRDPDKDDLQEMNYLEQILKESLRLYPPVPVIGRTLLQEMILTRGRVIPKGTQVIIMLTALHRNKAWLDPESFNPENFSLEQVRTRHPFGFVPFSAGPRNCLGKTFSMMEMKSAMSKMIRKFRFLPSIEPAHQIKLAAEMVLDSTTGVHVRIQERG